MVANDRPGPVAPLAPTPAAPARQTASFSVASFRIAIAAGPGSITLTLALDGTEDAYALEPVALGSWADASARLLELEAAATASEEAEFRAPFLADVEGRACIAFACAVTERELDYRLLVVGAAGRIATVPTDSDTVEAVIQAARGAVAVEGSPAPGGPESG